MHILTLNTPLNISGDAELKNNFTLLPNVDYVIADIAYEWLAYHNKTHHIIKKEDFYERAIEEKGMDFKYTGQDLNGKSIIVFRQCGIGDTLFIFPCLKELKRLYPLCKIICALDPEYISLAMNLPYIDELKPFPLTFEEICKADHYVDLEGVLEKDERSETIGAYEMHALRFRLPLDIDFTSDVNIEKSYIQNIKKDFLNSYPKEYKKVVIAVGTSSPVRTPDIGLFIDLINNYPWKETLFFFVGTQAEIPIIDLIIKNISNYPKETLINFPKIAGGALQSSLALITECSLFIGPDSGLIHVAGVVGKPLIGLYGAFPSALRLNHYKKAPTFGIDSYSSCKYGRGEWNCCFTLGGSSCKASQDVLQKYPPCMLLISHNHIIKAIKECNIY